MATLPASERLSDSEFERITELAYRTCGINLKKGKRELVQSRLAKKVREGHFKSFHEYYISVVADRTGEEVTALVDALTTNFTSFYREPAHFDFLRKTIAPQFHRPLRIWSAGCSSGEEPFTIAFSLLEELGIPAFDQIRILATDISTRALAAAEQATYASLRLDELPTEWLRKYLLRCDAGTQVWYRVKPRIRSMIEFRRLNLIEPFSSLPTFDVIFCRNVMIYFHKSTQEELVGRLVERLAPGGYLLIGHSESLNTFEHRLEYVMPAVYRRPLEQ